MKYILTFICFLFITFQEPYEVDSSCLLYYVHYFKGHMTYIITFIVFSLLFFQEPYEGHSNYLLLCLLFSGNHRK